MRLIDGDALKERLKELREFVEGPESPTCDFIKERAFEMAIAAVDEAGVVEPEPVKHGRWIMIDAYCNHSDKFQCSACRGIVYYSHYTRFLEYDRCPFCGAYMDEDDGTPPPSPAWMIEIWMAGKMTKEELAEKLGIPVGELAEMMRGERRITEEMAHALDETIGLPATPIIQLENGYREWLERMQHEEEADDE